MRNRAAGALVMAILGAARTAVPAPLWCQTPSSVHEPAPRLANSRPALDARLAPARVVPEPLVAAGLSAAPREGPAEVRWYHAVAAVAALGAFSAADETIRDEVQDHRSSGGDDAAKVFRRMGQPEVYAPVALGTLAAGLISGNDKVTRSGGRIIAGLVLSGAVASALKPTVGRRRPFLGEEQYTFRPFTSASAWPSGHTATAFALATSLSDEIHSTPVTVGLYTLAALTGWSRINDNRHWFTDVLSGAAIGITSAKLMNGHWRVFGIGAPRFLLEPGSVGVAMEW